MRETTAVLYDNFISHHLIHVPDVRYPSLFVAAANISSSCVHIPLSTSKLVFVSSFRLMRQFLSTTSDETVKRSGKQEKPARPSCLSVVYLFVFLFHKGLKFCISFALLPRFKLIEFVLYMILPPSSTCHSRGRPSHSTTRTLHMFRPNFG